MGGNRLTEYYRAKAARATLEATVYRNAYRKAEESLLNWKMGFTVVTVCCSFVIAAGVVVISELQ